MNQANIRVNFLAHDEEWRQKLAGPVQIAHRDSLLKQASLERYSLSGVVNRKHNTRRMFGVGTASRACKTSILLKGQRPKSCHTFLPEGIQIEDLTQASCHA